jgi:hypothetical protein
VRRREDELRRLVDELYVRNRPWATIPWKVSSTEARAAAAKSGRPLFLAVNTGNRSRSSEATE